MDSDTISPVHFVAAQLAVIVAVIHLSLGTLNWARWMMVGFLVPRDLRWPLFVISGAAIIIALFLAAAGADRRPLYIGGIAFMVVYIVGYFGWHVGGHRSLLLFGPGTQHTGPLLPFLLDHLLAGPVEFVTIVSEVSLLVLLVYLLLTESK
jgi:hypothetical protein